MTLGALLLLLLGLVLGTALGLLWERSRRATRADPATSAALDGTARVLLETADRQLAQASAPIHESLRHLDDRLREIEQGRVAAQAALARQIEDVRTTGEELRGQTAALVTALRTPQVRGRWGELHLRRAVELAGLVDRCDFTEQLVIPAQEGADSGDGSGPAFGTARPDLVVHLAGDKHVVVDAKVPLGAFLEAAEAADEVTRQERLRAHAKQLRAHVDTLASRAYWKRMAAAGAPTAEFVVLFVPGEAFLSHALSADPELVEYAAERKVVLASPITLITLLRTVAYAWTQDTLASEARTIVELGRELYDRIGVFTEALDTVGRSLGASVAAYNRAVGSLDTRLLVTARRLRELGLDDGQPPSARSLDTAARAVAQPPE
ncbi:DNA recombination protein RmuC [Actinospica sp.]|uniref:DNA recombination protein RmuC n=1 Tax=Actinospica sp. TaxID=1872142 RepID=UPI002BFEB624|nr:DNA recombination protein RmuC [Actinospica sp.]HWG28839.1 DNA recombination protein RmuC [Actinospica sp.]